MESYLAYMCDGSRWRDEEVSLAKFSAGHAHFQLAFSIGLCTEKTVLP